MLIPSCLEGEDSSLVETLTRSELKCLELTSSGFSAEAIARKLAMATHEVETLLFCAERKLSAQNRMHAISRAASMRLINGSD